MLSNDDNLMAMRMETPRELILNHLRALLSRYTQAQVGALTGLSPQSMRMWIKGKQNPSRAVGKWITVAARLPAPVLERLARPTQGQFRDRIKRKRTPVVV